MNRTTINKLRAVVPHIEEGINLTPFCDLAYRTVQKELVVTGLYTDEAELADIELYLAGHYATVAHPVMASESGTGVSGSAYRPSADKGLEATPCGQILIGLESTGVLRARFRGVAGPRLEGFGT